MDLDSFALAASTADLDEEPAAREHADIVEFRMDLADAPLEALRAYDGDLPVLATNRAPWEGGGAGDGESGGAGDRRTDGADGAGESEPGGAGGDETDEDVARLDALAEAAGLAAVAAVDVELRSLTDGSDERRAAADRAVEAARAADAAVVVSAHDFSGTPPVESMREMLSRACALGDVGKLAITAASPRDVLDLLAVTDEFASHGERVATMAMGEAGRHSRAVAPCYGSRIGYAPVDPARATAPGQYDLATIAGLVDVLGGADPACAGSPGEHRPDPECAGSPGERRQRCDSTGCVQKIKVRPPGSVV